MSPKPAVADATTASHSAEPTPWQVGDVKFILSAERLTGVLAWSLTTTVSSLGIGNNGGTVSTSTEFSQSGTDVSLLGVGLASRNVYGAPRLALDGRFSNGLTLGGAISYSVQSREHEEGVNATKMSVSDPTTSTFVLAPRIGVLYRLSPAAAIWLRGGVTRVSVSTETTISPAVNGATLSDSDTATAVAVTLDPQVVITPIPHVGITLGLALDFGTSGTEEMRRNGETTSRDFTASSYGVTAGTALLF